MIVAFEYVANILKQVFKWFPWQLPFFGDRRVLLSVLLDWDQPCNIKCTRFQHCQVMRSSQCPTAPELAGKLAACQAFFADEQGHTSWW